MPRRTVLPTIGKAPNGHSWLLRRVQNGTGIFGKQGHTYYLEVSKDGKKIYETNFFVPKGEDPQPVVDKVADSVRKKFS